MRSLACACTLLLFAPVPAALAQVPASTTQTAAPPAHVSRHDRDEAQSAFEQGGKAVQQQQLAEAVAAFDKAAILDPSNLDYDAARAIARDNLATQLMQQALKARTQGDVTGFRSLMLRAAAEDAHNPLVIEHRADLAAALDTDRDAELEQVHGTLGAPVALEPAKGLHSFDTSESGSELARQVLSAYGVSPMIDASVSTDRVHFEADNVDFAKAVQLLELATDTFIVPLDPVHALVLLDTRTNRDRYERLSLETLYIPGSDQNTLNDLSNMARNVFSVEHVSIDQSADTLTLRATETNMRAFNQEIRQLIEGRSEVMLDVAIYEVQRQYASDVGASLPTSTTIFNVDTQVNSLIAANPSLVQQIISSGLANPGNLAEIALALVVSGQAGSTLLSQPFAIFGGGITTSGLTLAPSTANATLSSSDTRMLDDVQLHLLDQEEGSVKVGEQYPIVTSSYSNLATGSTSISGISAAGLSSTLQNLGVNLATLSSAATAAVPQVQYQDIGLQLNATPRVMADRHVSLTLRFQLSSLTGQTLNGNPIINNRQLDSIIDVRPGERTVLVSQLSNQESHTLTGLPFLSEIPGFTLGTELVTNRTRDAIVIIVTPHILRLNHQNENTPMVMLPTHS